MARRPTQYGSILPMNQPGAGIQPLDPTDPYAAPVAPPTVTQTPFGGWNAQNIFDEDYWQQVNEQAKQGAFTESRDDISRARDAFIQPYEQRYHELAAAQGARAEGGGGLLSQDPMFRAFVQQGQMPTFQTSTQQWNAVPAAEAPPLAPPPGGGYMSPTATTPGASGNDFIKQLMERAKQGLNVDRTDPAVRSQSDAYAANEERARRRFLTEVAERQGGRPVNLLGEERLASERAGQRSGAFESELIGREIGARRDEIAQALQMWGNQLSNDQRVALERELAALNDRARTLDREQQGSQFSRSQAQQMEQFLRELALREWESAQGWDARWAGI